MELQQNPFFILRATPRDDRQRLAELADEASLSADPDVCQKARTELANPRKRLAAEISWFPGISPAKTKQLITRLESDTASLRDLKESSGIVRFNLLTAALPKLQETRSANLSQWVFEIARSFEDIEIEELCKSINEDRAVSGFPEVTDHSWVENEIGVLRTECKKIINSALAQLRIADRTATLTFMIESATGEGNESAPVLIHDLIDDYELETKAELEKGESKINGLVENIKKQATEGASDESLSAMIAELLSTLEVWDKTAQPIQVNKKSQGLDHDTSQSVAWMVRGLAIHLYNEHRMLEFAQRIISSLQKLFSELLDVSELTEKDAETLKNLEQNQVRERLYAGLEKISGAPSLRTINGFGFMLYGSTDTDPLNGSYMTTYYFSAFFIPIFPICRYRVISNGKSYSFLGKAPLRNFDKWHLGIVAAIIVAFAINAMSDNKHHNSGYQTPVAEPAQEAPAPAPIEEPVAAPAAEAPAATNPDYLPNQQNTYSSPIDTVLKDEIEQGKLEVESMESNMRRLKSDIESNKALLASYEASGDDDSYNRLVPDYNAQLDEWRSYYRKYTQQLDEVNSKISRYNAGER